MSILSKKSLIKELGKGIFYHPLKINSIRSCNFCLTASEYAYSTKNKQRLEIKNENENKKYLEIPPNDTVLIWTDESIWLSQNFCASLHSTTTLVSKGIGHIGTRINPNWCGVLSIAFHNLSDNPVNINIKDAQNPIAYLMIHKLTSQSEKQGNIDGGSRLDILEGLFNTQEIYDFYQKRDNRWMRDNVELLKEKMIHSKEYLKLKDNFWTIAYRESFNESKNIGIVFVSLLTFFAGTFTNSEIQWMKNSAYVVVFILIVSFMSFLSFGLYKFITNIINRQSSENNE